MTDAMVEPFIDRFTDNYNRAPSRSGIALIESSVGTQKLLPDIVVHEEIVFVAHKQCNLPHIKSEFVILFIPSLSKLICVHTKHE